MLLKDLTKLLTEMTLAEKAQALQILAGQVGDAFPGIESIPGVSGGDPIILRTRIPIWLLVQARQSGVSEADLLRGYPSLRAQDLANAWAYYSTHQDEIDRQIAENENA